MYIKNSILAFLFLFPFLMFSQEKNQTDENGERHGVWKKNYDHTDQVRYEGQFEHGKETGVFKYYTLDKGKSILSATKDFDAKTGIAEAKFISSKGKLISEGKLNGRLYMGKWTYYHNKTDAVMSTETYNDNGKLEGEKLVFYEDGQVAEKVFYKDGMIQGLNTWYSENGKVLKEFLYKDNVLHGISKFYDGEGVLVTEGEYRNGMKHGIWKYYEEGKLKEEKDFTVKSKNPIKQD
ncbi:Antitoxin component YwqK of the YwqJK toxin-antitoxin module [Flavobacteriaceae bacterium MAR_2010_188]|nr:Antitoxin component YwqK of the YwqJK toxin-antitoxin module [Flavobacteriaceae bacterium MAR_2010_188]